MRARIPVGVVAPLLGCLLITQWVEAQQVRPSNRSGITVWQEADFKGTSATFGTDVPDLTRFSFQRAVSSLRTAPGETWQVCDQPYYRGRCHVFTGSISDLDGTQWNDRIMSIRRVNVSGGQVATEIADEVANTAIEACANELGRHGWSILNATTPRRAGSAVTLDAQVRSTLRSQQATARCVYDTRSRTVRVTF